MAIAICGHGESGKDSFARFFANAAGLRFEQSTSGAAADLVWRTLFSDKYPSALDCWDDRRNHRKAWRDCILSYNRSAPSGVRLYEEMLAANDLLVGIRDWSELSRMYEFGLVTLSIWVERVGVEDDPSCSVLRSDCDIVVYNTGSLEALNTKAQRLASSFKILEGSCK